MPHQHLHSNQKVPSFGPTTPPLKAAVFRAAVFRAAVFRAAVFRAAGCRIISRRKQEIVLTCLLLIFNLFLDGFTQPALGQLAGQPQAGQPQAGKARCWTYTRPDGESFFALSLSADVNRAETAPRQIVLLFDTSASQTGYARTKALAVLEELVKRLRPNDLVKLFAVDVQAVPLTPKFVSPQSDAFSQSLKKLKLRTPLGATDLPDALKAAQQAFDSSNPDPQVVLYIGDGLSAAQLVVPETLAQLVSQLAQARISVNSYAVGPRVDTPLLATIANHTGGVVAVEHTDFPAKKYAHYLANAVRASVFWTVEAKLPRQFAETLPKKAPPLRSDRDSVLIGRGQLPPQFEVTWVLEVPLPGGPRKRQLTWTVEPLPSDDTHSYLPELVERNRSDGGIRLPLPGSDGLVEARLALNQDLKKLIVLARQAVVATNSLDSAETLCRKALQLDPTSVDAQNLLSAIKQKWFEEAQKAAKKEQFDQAVVLCLRALKIDPEFQEATEFLKQLPQAPRGRPVSAKPDGQQQPNQDKPTDSEDLIIRN